MISEASEKKVAVGLENRIRNDISESRYAASHKLEKGFIYGIEDDLAYSLCLMGAGYGFHSNSHEHRFIWREQLVVNLIESPITKRIWALIGDVEMLPNSKRSYEMLDRYVKGEQGNCGYDVGRAFSPLRNQFGDDHAWRGLFGAMFREISLLSRGLADPPDEMLLALYYSNPNDARVYDKFMDEIVVEWRDRRNLPNIVEVAGFARENKVDLYVPIGKAHVNSLHSKIGPECNGLSVHAYQNLSSMPKDIKIF